MQMLGLAVLELGKLPTTEAELQALQVTPGWPTSHRVVASIQLCIWQAAGGGAWRAAM